MMASLMSKIIPSAYRQVSIKRYKYKSDGYTLSKPTILLARKKIQLSATKKPAKDNIQDHLGGLSASVPINTKPANIHPAANPNTMCTGAINSLTTKETMSIYLPLLCRINLLLTCHNHCKECGTTNSLQCKKPTAPRLLLLLKFILHQGIISHDIRISIISCN